LIPSRNPAEATTQDANASVVLAASFYQRRPVCQRAWTSLHHQGQRSGRTSPFAASATFCPDAFPTCYSLGFLSCLESPARLAVPSTASRSTALSVLRERRNRLFNCGLRGLRERGARSPRDPLTGGRSPSLRVSLGERSCGARVFRNAPGRGSGRSTLIEYPKGASTL